MVTNKIWKNINPTNFQNTGSGRTLSLMISFAGKMPLLKVTVSVCTRLKEAPFLSTTLVTTVLKLSAEFWINTALAGAAVEDKISACSILV
ncbi:hypothetical protein D3C86_628640 [compost metagenome]